MHTELCHLFGFCFKRSMLMARYGGCFELVLSCINKNLPQSRGKRDHCIHTQDFLSERGNMYTIRSQFCFANIRLDKHCMGRHKREKSFTPRKWYQCHAEKHHQQSAGSISLCIEYRFEDTNRIQKREKKVLESLLIPLSFCKRSHIFPEMHAATPERASSLSLSHTYYIILTKMSTRHKRSQIIIF